MFFASGKSPALQGCFIFLLLSLAATLLISCSSHEIIAQSPGSLFAKAEKAYQDGSLSKANELFQAVQNEFPDSEYAKLALLRTADISYRKIELKEAARTYNDFINFNENHPKAPYAYYQSGMCHFKEFKTIDRDLIPLKQALEIFQEALARYPDSPPYTDKIIQRINDCKRLLAKHEFYIGFFYFKQEKFNAAIKRFEYLLQTYPGFIDDKVLYYLGVAYLNYDEPDKGHRALLTLTKGFPKSPYTPQALPLLEKDEGPGVPLLFMVRDYFLLHEEDINDRYVTTPIASEDHSPRFFNMFGNTGKRDRTAEEVTFASLYRPTTPPAAKKKGDQEPRIPPAPETPGAPPIKGGAGSPSTAATAAKTSGVRQQARIGRRDEPLEIISDWTEADRQKGTISFGGKVIAKQKDMVLYADKVVNYFDMQNRKLIRAVAVGNVKLNQADKFVTCEKAELIQAERKVILTGNPVMWQGENRVTGDKIVIYLNDNQAEVYGSKQHKAKVRITPNK
ncbi:MAG: outer membrane protein assembly factor BamD [Deltaproteobacteria bacterium]|nr:outer membrane protein assembly factor BamD [Deltaproteobacteria bacterium]